MDKEQIKKNVQSTSLWYRVGMTLFFLLLLGFFEFLVVLITLLQLAFIVITGEPNANLKKLGRGFGKYVCHMIQFLTFNTDNKPFPFTDWPSDSNPEI